MQTELKVCHVSYAYHSPEGEVPALSDLSFTVHQGEFLSVIGPSGCGKSTLLSLLCGLLRPEQGEILLGDRPVSDSRKKIGIMLQQDQLFEWRTVFENTALGLEIQKRLTSENRERLEQLLTLYGLKQFEQARPSALSGGMRQRAALIRTLILDPELLLLDEPFSALDYQTRLTVCNDISSIIREQKKTAVLVTHDLAEALSVADRILVLTKRPGKIQTILTPKFSGDYGGDCNGDRDGDCSGTFARRNSPEFSVYFNQLWKEIQDASVS